jgi:uncharacterized protein YfiM (DUF2279 family)
VAACVVALVVWLLGGLIMSSAANRAARVDRLTGGVLWVFAAALLATALYAAVTGSAVAQKALTWVVAAAAAGVAFLVAAYVPTSR